MDKQAYSSPKITDFGTVADMTQTGDSRIGGDLKAGSVLSPGR